MRSELRLDLREDLRSEVVALDEEVLSKPVLSRAGIFDYNSLIDHLPEEIVSDIGQFPNTDLFLLQKFVHEVKQGSFGLMNYPDDYFSRTRKDKKFPPVQRAALPLHFTHYLYRATPDGLIDKIRDTDLFSRQYGIAQLGLRDDYPMPNTHTRGEHAEYVAVNMARSLQALYDRDADLLVARLREDFRDESFYDPDMDDAEVIELATDLSVVAGMGHDMGTSAGGDTLKYQVGLDEEEDLEWLFSGQREVLQDEIQEFCDVLAGRGMSEEHIQFCIKCVRGESSSLIGDMINPCDGDRMDWDRVGYTLLDGEAVGMLSFQMPSRFFSRDHIPVEAEKSLDHVHELANMVMRSHMHGMLRFPLDYSRRAPSASFIDPSEDVKLDERGRFVCTRPDKLAWVAASRIWMTGLHYAGGKMLGFETKLQRELTRLGSEPMVAKILSRENLLSVTTDQLYDQLSEVGDRELSEVLYEIRWSGLEHDFESSYVADDVDTDEAWASYPVKIKPGLDSLVEFEGEVMSLSRYLELNRGDYSSWWVRSGQSHFKDKKVVINPKENGEVFWFYV